MRAAVTVFLFLALSGHFENVGFAHTTAQAGVFQKRTTSFLSTKIRQGACSEEWPSSCPNALIASCAVGGYKVITPDSSGDANAQCSCQPCDAGTFALAPLMCEGSCQFCEPGSYSPTAGAKSCSLCLNGAYSDDVKSTECKQCIAGKYTPPSPTNSNGYSACLLCPANQASAAGASVCGSCAAGQYMKRSIETGTTNELRTCETCAGATYTTVANELSECRACPVGATASSDHLSCSCPAGSQWDAANGACSACGAGFYSARAGATCTPCASGTYAHNDGATSCTTCANGVVANNRRDCSCNAGYALIGDVCTQCTSGKYSAGVTATECSTCEAGSYAAAGSAICRACYGDVSNGDQCTCRPGTGWNDQIGNCQDCGAGTYSPNTVGNCLTCPDQTYQPGTKATECISCSSTSGVVSNGGTTCTCKSGYQMDSTTMQCVPCAAGTAGTGGSCRRCDDGMFQMREGQTECLSCAGNPSEDRKSCSCRAGSGWDTTTLNCVECPSGKFSIGGQAACHSCGADSYQPNPRASTCLKCDGTVNQAGNECSCRPGYGLSSQTQDCEQCKKGMYSPGGTGQCTACPNDQYSDAEGAVSCKSCSGTINDAKDHCEPPSKLPMILGIVFGVLGFLVLVFLVKRYYFDKRQKAKGTHKADDAVDAKDAPGFFGGAFSGFFGSDENDKEKHSSRRSKHHSVHSQSFSSIGDEGLKMTDIEPALMINPHADHMGGPQQLHDSLDRHGGIHRQNAFKLTGKPNLDSGLVFQSQLVGSEYTKETVLRHGPDGKLIPANHLPPLANYPMPKLNHQGH